MNGGGESPDQTPEPAPAAGGAPAPGGDSEAIKNIQQLTGKLAQDMRSAGANLQPKDAKAAINSILAAIDVTKLTDSDKNDITSKLNGQGKQQQPQAQPQQPAAPQPGVNEETPNGFDAEDAGKDNSMLRFTASGGQSVGEGAINERLMTILEKAKANVQNKMKK